jgi:hypothetical protein
MRPSSGWKSKPSVKKNGTDIGKERDQEVRTLKRTNRRKETAEIMDEARSSNT